MAVTKQQALNFTANRKKAVEGTNSKYYYWGTLHILVQNDIVTPEMIAAEFPEFA